MKLRIRITALFMALVFAMLFAFSCSDRKNDNYFTPSNTERQYDIEKTGTEDYNGKLVYDRSMELLYAKCFSVDYYKGGYKLISVIGGTKLLIVPEGMSVPSDTDGDTIVLRQPVKNILVSSTPTTSLINAIGALDAISMTTTDYDSWYINDVKNALSDKSMTYIGEYNAPDYEIITASGVDFAIFSAMLTGDVAEQLKQLGIRIMLDRAAEEEHPLARVEWMKLYGAMFNMEEKAEQLVNEQIAYVDRISKAEAAGKSVAVFYITSKGALYARNAGDYMAKMVELAGGEYILSDTGIGQPGTTNMEMEAFYDEAKDSDYIIYIWSVGGKPEKLDDLLAKNEILADMKAVRDGNVFCTAPDFFQISNTLGSMINDINLMLNSDENTGKLTYLFRLK